MNTYSHSHRPGILTRLALALTGSHRDRADWAGRDDQARIRLLGLAVMLLALWIGFNLHTALTTATGEASWRVLLLSALMAGMYVTIDLSILLADWSQRGARLARARGLTVGAGRWAAVGGWFVNLPAGVLRLGLSAAVAWFTAVNFGLWLWAADIDRQLAVDAAAANSGLILRIEAEEQAALAAMDADIAAIEERLSVRNRATASAAAVEDAGRATALLADQQNLTQLVGRLAAVEAEIACARTDQRAEQFGRQNCAGQTRPAGTDAGYDLATGYLSALTTEKAELIAARDVIASRLAAPVPDPAPDLLSQMLRDQLGAERDARRRLAEGQGDRVRSRVAADAAYVPPASGLIARQQALAALGEGVPAVATQLWTTKAMFLLLDLALLAIAFGRAAPSVYAVRQVVEFETRTAAEIASAHEAFAMAEARSATAQADVLRARATLMRAERDFRNEATRIAVTETALRHLQQGFDPGAPRPRFDA